MKDFIHAKLQFQTFDISLRETVDKYGELRFSNVPSVVVEIAFHTNVEDAGYLLDPVFRKAAMQGVERGWRSYKNGGLLDCAIDTIVEP